MSQCARSPLPPFRKQSRICLSSRPSPAADGTQQQLLKQSFSGLTSESHSITTLRGSTHCYCLPSETPAHSGSFQRPPAHPCSFQQSPAHSCSIQRPPEFSSSLLQLLALRLTPPAPAHSCGALLMPCYCPLTSSDLFQRLLTSGYRSRTNDLCRPTTHRSQNKDTISIVYYRPSAFVILLCYSRLFAFVSALLVVRSIGTHTSQPTATYIKFNNNTK
ncbi:unnamed protein product [Acanthosepion pharaonis]|uniref:Uncharacterized protein n=1 Tax=Acanthosepion pharaonis TaxID=158019 RepID=A0A812AS81_ACAPH|nr:unnamed protein product [Sepia pharaonis]